MYIKIKHWTILYKLLEKKDTYSSPTLENIPRVQKKNVYKLWTEIKIMQEYTDIQFYYGKVGETSLEWLKWNKDLRKAQ